MSNAAARREARRQRILDNAENRLKKVLGQPIDVDEYRESDGQQKKVPITKATELKQATGGASFNATNDLLGTYTSNATEDCTEEEETVIKNLHMNSSVAQNGSVIKEEHIDFENRQKARKVVIAMLALLVRCMFYCLEQYTKIFYKWKVNQVFVPFLAYEAVELTFFRLPLESNFLILLLRSRMVSKIADVIKVFCKVMQDMLVYFFVFSLVDMCFAYFEVEKVKR